MILDIIATSSGRPFVRMSSEVLAASENLRDFLFERVYYDGWRAKEEARCDYILSELFRHYTKQPEQMPKEYLAIADTDGAGQAVCDFLACMTDRYAIDLFTEIFVPNAFPVRRTDEMPQPAPSRHKPM
jgi:dGTPase